MKKIIALLIPILLLSLLTANAENVSENHIYDLNVEPPSANVKLSNKTHKVIDKATLTPVSNVQIFVPIYGYTTYTNDKGEFKLPKNLNKTTVLSAEKYGYRPSSKTINKNLLKYSVVVFIEKSAQTDIVLDNNLCHIGDNVYSVFSNHAKQFKLKSVGKEFTIKFYANKNIADKINYLVIGSVIGIDTKEAHIGNRLSILMAEAYPATIYLNNVKIHEIKTNGDNQRILMPNNLIKWNQQNEIKIKAGINPYNTERTDYDDFELMNLIIQQ